MVKLFAPGTRLLFVGAHPDDIELGCGGTLARLRMDPALQIRCLVFSDRMDTMVGRNLQEMYHSLAMLGISAGVVDISHIPTRIFIDYRPAIRQTLIEARKAYRPEAVFCHSARDLHQDHRVVYEEAGRIFRNEALLGYEVIRSSYLFSPQLYIKLEPQHLRRKVAALRSYRSQIEGGQSAAYYFKPSVIRSWAIFRGAHCESSLAEAFEVYRQSF